MKMPIAAVLLFVSTAALGQPVFNNPPSSSSSSGSGDVVGPASATDNAVCRYDGHTGKAVQGSAVTMADTTGDLSFPGAVTISTAASNGDITLAAHGTGGVAIGSTGTRIVQSSDPWTHLRLTDAAGSTPQVMTFGNVYSKSVAIYGNSFSGSPGYSAAGNPVFSLSSSSSPPYIGIAGGGYLSISDAGSNADNGSSQRLYADGSGVFALKNGATPQGLRIYGAADSHPTLTNYERLSMSCDGIGDCTIATETAGTGLDDVWLNLSTGGSAGVRMRRHVVADTNGETTTAIQSNTLWTNTGDADGQAFTLLNDPTIGVQYCFAVDAAHTLTVAPSAGESLYFGTDQCVVSLTSNSVGSTLCVVATVGGSGGKWMTLSSMGSWTCND